MSGASEKTGTITITVPFTARETGFDFGDDIGSHTRDDERWLSVHRGKRELKIAEADIGKAVLAAWPGEAATGERAKRLAEIAERVAECDASQADAQWLLAEVTAADSAFTTAVIPDDGRSLAERIASWAVQLRTVMLNGAAGDLVQAARDGEEAFKDVVAERDELRRDVARLSALKTAEVAPILDRFVERFAGLGIASPGDSAGMRTLAGLPPPEPDLEPAVGDEPA